MESKTERDGLLSYSSEWHSFLLGILFGMVSEHSNYDKPIKIAAMMAIGEKPNSKAPKKLNEITKEPWYAAAGILIGIAIGIATNKDK